MSDMSKFTITRRIEIDMAHRVPDHGSKCKHLHGHRYVILGTCEGPLYEEGEQAGMVLDFGFLKDLMIQTIHDPHDHGLTLYNKDPILDQITARKINTDFVGMTDIHPDTPWLKLYLIDAPPTAEVLAAHWYRKLSYEVSKFTESHAKLRYLEVYETPNSIARYPS